MDLTQMVCRKQEEGAAMSMLVEIMFGYSALIADLPCGPILLKESFAFISSLMFWQDSPPLEVLAQHCKDPI